MKKFLSILLASIMLVSFTACGSAESEAPSTGDAESAPTGELVKKDTLSVVLSSEPTNLNPQVINMLNSYIIEFLIYDTLLEKDADGNIIPNLATEWEVIDDTHIRFKLRDDVYFSNGTHMTAEDVRFTIERAATYPTTTSTFSYFDAENTVVEDDYTIVIALHEPFSGIYNFLTHAYSSVVSKEYIEEVGDDVAGLEPIGTGAYTLDEWVTGSTITLKRNEEYWGTKGESEYIQFKIITEIASRAIELETGAADIALDLATNDAKRVSETEGLVLQTGPSYKTAFIGLNQSKEEMLDPKIREAMAISLDYEGIAYAVYGEYGTLAQSIMSTAIIGQMDVKDYTYDVERAKELLAEAGYPDGITLSGRCQQNSDFKKTAEIVQNMWKEAGINVDIQVLDKATYSEAGKTDGGTHVTVTSQTATTGDPFQAVGSLFSTASRIGIVNSVDENLDALINTAASLYEDEARNAAYAEVQDYIVNNYIALPIAYTNILTGTSDNVENFVISPANTPNLSQVYAYAD